MPAPAAGCGGIKPPPLVYTGTQTGPIQIPHAWRAGSHTGFMSGGCPHGAQNGGVPGGAHDGVGGSGGTSRGAHGGAHGAGGSYHVGGGLTRAGCAGATH
jgi:hypothetical protein